MRGFLPALALLALYVFSLGCWIVWQGDPGPERRAALTRGAITYCWETSSTWRFVGRAGWTLGSNMIVNGRRVRWIGMGVSDSGPIWSWSRVREAEWSVVVEAGTVRVPLVYPTLLAALAPAIILLIRWKRQRPAWACARCGYDLRAVTAGICPECGAQPIHPIHSSTVVRQ